MRVWGLGCGHLAAAGAECNRGVAAVTLSGMEQSTTLRAAAEKSGLLVGAAVAPQPLAEDADYGRVLGEQFNCVVAENVMKPRWTQPQRGVFDFAAAQPLVDFAAEHGQALRGHTLCWHNGLPDWMEALDPQHDDVASVLRDHIHGVADRFRNTVVAWDVINEVFDNGTYRDTVWHRALGDDLLPSVFRWAHQHAPETKLFYNDYGIDAVNGKSDLVYLHVRRMLDEGVPIHGLGMQMHIKLDGEPSAESLSRNIERFTDLGLEVHITEMDVRVKVGEGAKADRFERQAERYRTLLAAAFDNPAVTAVLFWGITDRRSWVPKVFEGFGDALLFDHAMEPKPAFFAVREAIAAAGPRTSRS